MIYSLLLLQFVFVLQGRENFPWMIKCMSMYALSWVAFIAHSQFCVCISQCSDRCYSSVFLNVDFYTYYRPITFPCLFLFSVTGSTLKTVQKIEPTFTRSSCTLISTGSNGNLVPSGILRGLRLLAEGNGEYFNPQFWKYPGPPSRNCEICFQSPFPCA